MQLASPGDYTIYYEYQSVVGNKVYATSESLPPLTVNVIAKDSGAAAPARPPMGSEHYRFGGRAGRSVLAFRAEQPGSYLLSAAYPQGQSGPEVVLAVGQGMAGGLVAGILGSIGLLFASHSGAIAAITFVKRRKADQRAG